MPRAQARGDQPRGKLKAGLDADFNCEVVRVFELIVANDWHEGAEHLEGAIEIQARFDGVGQADLRIPAELECAPAVVPLDIKRAGVIIVYIKLLPNRTHASADERTEFYLSGPTENCVQLNGNLHEFAVG